MVTIDNTEEDTIGSHEIQKSIIGLDRELDRVAKPPADVGSVVATPSYNIAWCATTVTSKLHLIGYGVCCYHPTVLSNVKGIKCKCCKLYAVHCNTGKRPKCLYLY